MDVRHDLPRPAALGLALAALGGCAALQDLSDLSGTSEPALHEIVEGLEQALSTGAARAVGELATRGGYLEDSLVRIPFPEEAEFAASALRKVGLGGPVDDFVERLNRGAEAGAKRALPIFEDAIREMSFEDARDVLFGGEHAATDYFRGRTYDALLAEFEPEITRALDDVGAIAIWSEVTTQFNRLPLTSRKVDTDIVHYVAGRAQDGLFLKLAAEEARIRADPVARSTALLQKVFAYAARRAEGG